MGSKNYSCHLALMVTFIAAMLAVAAGMRMMKASSSSCNGTKEGCMEANKEFEMMKNSEMNMAILESNNKVIGYGAMRGNGIPCRKKDGTSKNCSPGPAANPYNRGCSATNRCRGGGGGGGGGHGHGHGHGSTHG
ncbi:hypothetical protein PIB30_002812 [Stylosanthes scabra]|uniref:Rapid ALkalinization Factor n=1 Tax=Stylosanthes scabra TaxID=79078 RepID=A0ABU6T4W1_9FABA|nr:hypothetical protein [Stylosanthes scabra]